MPTAVQISLEGGEGRGGKLQTVTFRLEMPTKKGRKERRVGLGLRGYATTSAAKPERPCVTCTLRIDDARVLLSLKAHAITGGMRLSNTSEAYSEQHLAQSPSEAEVESACASGGETRVTPRDSSNRPSAPKAVIRSAATPSTGGPNALANAAFAKKHLGDQIVEGATPNRAARIGKCPLPSSSSSSSSSCSTPSSTPTTEKASRASRGAHAKAAPSPCTRCDMDHWRSDPGGVAGGLVGDVVGGAVGGAVRGAVGAVSPPGFLASAAERAYLGSPSKRDGGSQWVPPHLRRERPEDSTAAAEQVASCRGSAQEGLAASASSAPSSTSSSTCRSTCRSACSASIAISNQRLRSFSFMNEEEFGMPVAARSAPPSLTSSVWPPLSPLGPRGLEADAQAALGVDAGFCLDEEVAKAMAAEGEGEEDEGVMCAICHSSIKPLDAALVVGCEHAFCSGCILNWALQKKKCPLCNVHFERLWLYRMIDGSFDEYLHEESVDLLHLAPWFRKAVSTHYTPPAPTDDDDFGAEYDEDDDEFYSELEHRLTARSGGGRRAVGNRRWGENGWVASGRRAAVAKPVQPPKAPKVYKRQLKAGAVGTSSERGAHSSRNA